MTAVKKSKEAFRTISEVSAELDVPQHVLRFWETKFAQVKPMKRGGNRRYYRPEDVRLLHAIRHHLYTEGYTIKGVQKLLRERGIKAFIADYESMGSGIPNAPAAADTEAGDSGDSATGEVDVVKAVLEELRAIRKFIEDYKD